MDWNVNTRLDPDDEEVWRAYNHLTDAKAALSRPERTPAEAIIHIEEAIAWFASRGIK